MSRSSSQSRWSVYAWLFAALALACAVSCLAGAAHVPLGELWQSGILRLRLARTALAVVAGAGLSASGVTFQAVLRNPLAEPYLLGVSSGAGLGAMLALVLGLSAAGAWTLPAMAFVGAVATLALVRLLTPQSTGGDSTTAMILAGVVVSTVLGSVLMFVVSLAPAENLHSVVWWLLGSLQVFDAGLLAVVAAIVGVCLAGITVFSHGLNLLSLGAETASHLGLEVVRARNLYLLAASLMAAAVVAACGLIGFVGLIVPHCVRLAVGPDHRRLAPAAAIAGAVFLVAADCAARTALAPREIPIGVVTALLGSPVFIVLLRTGKARGGL